MMIGIGTLIRIFLVVFLTPAILLFLGVENAVLIVIAPFVLCGMMEFLIYIIRKQKAKNLEIKMGIIPLSKQEKEEKKQWLENDYNETKEEALKTSNQRYELDFATLKFALNLGKELAMNNVQTGIALQNTDAPQADWAIAGGLASGLAGGFAGAHAALDTMRQNAEATERQHQRGRELVKEGVKSYQSYEDSEREIMSETYDNFTYSKNDEELINKIKIELDSTENYGVGYIRASVKISADRNYVFPGTNKTAVIDGSVRVDLYDKDGVQLMASGYYCPPGRFGNDRTKTGFGLGVYKTITLKEEPGVTFNKHNGCQVKLSNPNLWLLML